MAFANRPDPLPPCGAQAAVAPPPPSATKVVPLFRVKDKRTIEEVQAVRVRLCVAWSAGHVPPPPPTLCPIAQWEWLDNRGWGGVCLCVCVGGRQLTGRVSLGCAQSDLCVGEVCAACARREGGEV